MDEAFWESFEPIFTEYARGGVTIGSCLDKIKNHIEASGYRCLESGGGHEFETKSAHDLWEKIQESMKEGGSVIYCRTNLKEGLFVGAKEIENDVVVQKTNYFDGEYEDTEYLNLQKHNEDLNAIGLEIREELKIVDGEQLWGHSFMFNRYHSAMEKMWFTDSVIIPHPFNMLLPTWLINAIRKGLTKRKV